MGKMATDTATAAYAGPKVPNIPFPGIRPFRFTDKPVFFGREEELETLVRAIKIYRGVLLYGDSGAGKSSLVNAGLFPDVMRRGYTPDRIRVAPTVGGELVVERIAADPDATTFLPSNFFDAENTAARLVLSTDACA